MSKGRPKVLLIPEEVNILWGTLNCPKCGKPEVLNEEQCCYHCGEPSHGLPTVVKIPKDLHYRQVETLKKIIMQCVSPKRPDPKKVKRLLKV